jgi:hypothetical protein
MEPSRDQPGDGTTVFSFTFNRPGYYVLQVGTKPGHLQSATPRLP